jgi:acyl-CoA synthetase (AMP-forming)/AMP-acid ligase II
MDLIEQSAAAEVPPAIILGGDGSQVPLPLLLELSRHAAWDLRHRGVHNGDRVGLILENGTGFFLALFAAMYAGAVAVPLALPQAMGIRSFIAHLRRVTADAEMRHIIVGQRVFQLLRRQQEAAAPLDATLIGEDELSSSGPRLADPADGESLALIQYTSGSTSSPKGVMLTHRNINAGLDAIKRASALTSADLLGLWLPLFHDMGLISALSGLTAGMSVVVWRPASFVRQPGEWLGEFAARGCTVCPAPNFFFDYLVEAADDVPGYLDLSRWRLAYNGAEPVNVNTIGRFGDRFSEHGFRREAMLPVYGMAEATLAVTFPRLGSIPSVLSVDRARLVSARRAVAARPGTPEAWQLVGVGRPVPGMQVRVADANGTEGIVNEIEITGASVTEGYFGRSGVPPFTADGWLRTGDIGFFDSGELYIAGRSKSTIVVRGMNYCAEDAEAIVRDLPGIFRMTCAAVATVTPAGERLAIVAETTSDQDDTQRSLVNVIRSEISKNLGLPDIAVHLVPPRTLPRTSSGKVQHANVRALFAAG